MLRRDTSTYMSNGDNGAQMLLDAIRVVSSVAEFEEPDVQVVWDATETHVALIIRHRVWAVFDTRTEAKFGGDYRTDGVPSVPEEIIKAFDPSIIKRNGR
jgi:hypothetical protein